MKLEHASRLRVSPLSWLTLDDHVRRHCQQCDAVGDNVSALAATILLLSQRRPGMKVIHLARLTALDKGQISRCAANLRKRGLLVEGRGGMHVSKAGGTLAAELRESHNRVGQSLLASLSAYPRDHLIRLATSLAPPSKGVASCTGPIAARDADDRSAVMLIAYVAAIVRRTYRWQLPENRGLHVTDLRTLEMLAYRPLPLFALAQAMSREISQMSRSIKRLEQSGLASAVHRATNLNATDAGLMLLADATKQVRALLCLRCDDTAERLLSSALRAVNGAPTDEPIASTAPVRVFQSGSNPVVMGRNVRGCLHRLVA